MRIFLCKSDERSQSEQLCETEHIQVLQEANFLSVDVARISWPITRDIQKIANVLYSLDKGWLLL